MKIIFHYTNNNAGFDETQCGSRENDKSQVPKVHLSLNEDDLIERRYSIETLWMYVKSNTLNLLG